MASTIEIIFKGRRLDYFVNPDFVPFSSGDDVIVEAERGIDMGRVAHLDVDVAPPERGGRFRSVIRIARPDDYKTQRRIRAEEEEAARICRERIVKLRLDMKLVDAESQIDGNRMTFYFTAEQRVDFRELVKELAAIFKTRIELRQIGARDAAKRLGGIGPCGREYCCSTWLKSFSPVTLKMAKGQGLALAPSKISGGCGRLMCCLMYEDPFYREMTRLFPKMGTRFDRDGQTVQVVHNDFFREVVRLSDGEGNAEEWPIAEFPFERGRWTGAVTPKGADKRGGEGSGCSKDDPKPTGMKNAKGGAGKTRIPIQKADSEESAKGAPFMHGGKKGARPQKEGDPPPPADMIRLSAEKRRREDGEEIGSGSRASDRPDLNDAELVASEDPPGTDPPKEDRPKRRRRRRRRRRGEGRSSPPPDTAGS